MKVSMVGLGKLGLPVATAMALKGHDVMGYDLDPSRMSYKPQSYREAGPFGQGDFNVWLGSFAAGGDTPPLRFGDLPDVVKFGEIVFVAVQTPHDPAYEGITPLPSERVDFSYTHLINVVQSIVPHITESTVLAIISTVLPGTLRREILPITQGNPYIHLVYNPSFIAMGVTMTDFLNPEFILVGGADPDAANVLRKFYSQITLAPLITMSLESAELTKVAYNTVISQRIAFANLLGEVCHKIPGADVDEVTGALVRANKRIISTSYWHSGMGDGGGCHPRDNIAMSWLARELNLSYDIFESVMVARERHARWLAKMVGQYACDREMPVVILGVGYKPETNLTVGSPALLVSNILEEEFGILATLVDPHVWSEDMRPFSNSLLENHRVYLIGCKHPEFEHLTFSSRSIVVDPFRYVRPDAAGEVVYIGRSMAG